MKVLVFDVWGEYAHFRKYYTTTSPLTFSVPPRTAICGLAAAVAGLSKDEYLEHFTKDKADIAIKIVTPIKKVRLSENLIDTKNAPMMSKIKNRTQIRFELLKDAKFRVYLSHKENELFNKLGNYLSNHKCVYTPCLGLSEHIANFGFVGEFECEVKSETENFVQIDSVIPIRQSSNLKIKFDESGGEYFHETLPIEMEEDRTLREYCKVVFERNGAPISAKIDQYWLLENGERIVFL
ncbi:MAG: CRISPR-associated protein Cas5h [Thermotogaceae bacterium]|jgi:CRISPR-associated protein Cas5h|nr:CRISPR-associated protein Cas5h [Methanolobus sp.]MDN5338597.1 CRISPR-associated protein Cas5h [Thermotogaceae bacterium]